MIGMALVAALMCVNFAACGGDDEEADLPQYELVTNGKKLTKIEITTPNGYNEVRNFNYDNEGRLIEVTYKKGNSRFIWSNNMIQDTNKGFNYTLQNGLIQNEFTYNEARRPKEYMGTTIMWDDDKMNRISTPYQDGNTTRYDFTAYYYNENGKVCNGFNPIIPIILGDKDLLIAHPELAGMRTTQLPTHYTDQDVLGGMSQGTYNYKFDSENYVKECTISEKSRIMKVYSMTWE